MYSREINGKEFSFGVSGKLIRNALVMYDRQTDSLWAQITGQAVQGPMKGAQLEFVPAIHTTWQDWKTRYPETLALVKGYTGNRSPYADYFSSDQAGILGEEYRDERLLAKEFVIGVVQNGRAVAYPFRVLNNQPVIQDQLNGTQILVVFDPQTGAGAVFERQIDQAGVLTFDILESLVLRDVQTGSIWDGLSGMAVDGALKGTQLSPVKSTAAFWFGWKDWYPNTRIFGQ